MNTTSDHQGPHGPGSGDTYAGPDSAPPPLASPHQDLDRLRRSVSDRYIAGVAGGLGRHFNIDPTVIRVLLAVLTLFGGAGVLIYAVCWLFVPEDGKERAGINISSDARKILLLAAAGIAALLAVGDAFSGFNAGWPIAAIAVVIAVIMIARDKRAARRSQPSQEQNQYAQQVTHEVTAKVNEQVAQRYGTAPHQPQSTWQPPAAATPILPPHPKRTGIIWFWPTLALIAIAMGIIGMIDDAHAVDVGVYPAVTLAIIGTMLVVGSMYGRPGGLIFLGIVSTIVLSAATVLGSFDFDGRHIDEAPTSAAAVQSSYSTHMGQIEIDLSRVQDYQNLAGRTIDLDLNAGQITVIVPRELNVHIDASMGFAGGINIPGYDGGGFEDSRVKDLAASPASNLPPLELDIDVRVGQIEVEQR